LFKTTNWLRLVKIQKQLKMNNITAFLVINNTETACKPLDALGLQIQYAPDDVFYHFRKSLSKDIVFAGSDYSLIFANKTAKIGFRIKRNSVIIFDGVFSIFDCKVDELERTIQVKPYIVDTIKLISDNLEKEYNILDIAETNSVNMSFQAEIQFVVNEYDKLNVPALSQGFGTIRSVSIVDFIIRLEAREWCQIQKDSTWIKEEPSWYNYQAGYVRSFSYSNPSLNGYLTTNATNNLFVAELNGTNYYIAPADLNEPIYTITTYNGRKLENVVKFLFAQFTTLNVYSSFLFQDITEAGVHLNTVSSVYSWAYSLDIQNLVLFQTTDLKKYTASNVATKASLSIAQLMNDLNVMFGDVGIFLQTNGAIRIEHKDYFKYSTINQYDLTQVLNNFSESYVKNLKKYEYSNLDFTKFENYAFYNAFSTINTAKIENVSEFELTGTLEKKCRRFNSDVEGLFKSLDSFSDDSIFIIRAVNNVIETISNVKNYVLQLYFLHSAFHISNNRISDEYLINDEFMQESANALLRLQKEIQFPFAKVANIESVNILNLRFKTFISASYTQIDSFNYDVYSDYANLTLKFPL